VIYTSGSTGRPKGVMNEHRGVVNRLMWMQETYGLHAGDVVLQKTPFGFDVSVWEFFWPLMCGARLVMARPDGHKDARYLAEAVQAHGVTTMHFVPSMLQVFLEQAELERCGSLVRVVCSGEALPAALVRQFHDRLPGVELHNLYGPTEAAVDVTAWACRPADASAIVPIGRAIANTTVYLLDAHGRPAPLGAAGELHIGGVQVARGYLGRPELTAERFVADPFSSEPGARLYRTGDLARLREDGAIEYLGRNDFQVKIRGLRIELGEIEARIELHAGGQEARVLVRDYGADDRRIVAYVVPSREHAPSVRQLLHLAGDAVRDDHAPAPPPQGEAVSRWATTEELARDLRAFAAERLPDYMVPAAVVFLDEMPLTVNGKLDRDALPAPEGGFAATAWEAPEDEIELALAGLWAGLLQVERVGRHDNFFDRGGHSLLATRLLVQVQAELGVKIGVQEFFSRPVLSAMAEMVVDAQLAQFSAADIDVLAGQL
jgi:acyl-coenzyme A synthetase/AMP-(fatty) acid ligase